MSQSKSVTLHLSSIEMQCSAHERAALITRLRDSATILKTPLAEAYRHRQWIVAGPGDALIEVSDQNGVAQFCVAPETIEGGSLFEGLGHDQHLLLELLYRDADNYKTSSLQAIAGPLSWEEVSIVLTALMSDDEGFIPCQFGLDDIQDQMLTSPDFSEEGSDGYLHEIADIRIVAAKENHGAVSGATALEAARRALTGGHDFLLAEERNH